MATSVKLPADDVGARKQRRDGIRGGRYGEIFLIGARIAAALPWPSQTIDTERLSRRRPAGVRRPRRQRPPRPAHAVGADAPAVVVCAETLTQTSVCGSGTYRRCAAPGSSTVDE